MQLRHRPLLGTPSAVVIRGEVRADIASLKEEMLNQSRPFAA